MKSFTLYSTKYKKTGFKSTTREDATFHSTFISHTQIGGKLENNLNKLLKKRTVHVLHQTTVPTSHHWRRLQHTFQCFWTKTCHATGRMKLFRKGHMTCQMLSIKWGCFLVCFIQNIRYLVRTSDITTSNDQGNILQISCKVALKKKQVSLCSAKAWIGTHATFLVISGAVVFRLFKVFSSSLQHIWRTYRGNICNQLIENTTIVSVDVILSV